MSKTVKAGSPALRKALRRFPGLRLVSAGGTGGHAQIVTPEGKVLRFPDGRKLSVVSSPRDGDRAARELLRQLEGLGYKPRRAA
jgi:hypothetical protein